MKFFILIERKKNIIMVNLEGSLSTTETLSLIFHGLRGLMGTTITIQSSIRVTEVVQKRCQGPSRDSKKMDLCEGRGGGQGLPR